MPRARIPARCRCRRRKRRPPRPDRRNQRQLRKGRPLGPPIFVASAPDGSPPSLCTTAPCVGQYRNRAVISCLYNGLPHTKTVGARGDNSMIRTFVLAAALAMALGGAAQAQSDPVKRGDYLVNTILTCGNCHSPMGPQGDIPGKHFSGGLSWDEPPFKVTAPNITQDKETGIGAWTNAQIKHVLRTGVRPNGVPLAAVMPVGFYKIMTDSDMDAIVAYLLTLQPIKNKVPGPVYRFPDKSQTQPGAEDKYTEAMLKDPVKHGFYLA